MEGDNPGAALSIGPSAAVASAAPALAADIVQAEPFRVVVQQPAIHASAERRTTEGSFHSAQEDMTAKVSFAVSEIKKPTQKRVAKNCTNQKGRMPEMVRKRRTKR